MDVFMPVCRRVGENLRHNSPKAHVPTRQTSKSYNRLITGTEYNPGLNQYDPLNEMSSIPGLHSCKVLTFPFLSSPGGHHPNHEDEEADQQRPAADGAGGDPEEHVSASEKDDKRADRVAHRAQIHKEGRGGHQHLHLHGLGSEDGVCVLLFFTTGLHLAL